jgi:hypothetical protein
MKRVLAALTLCLGVFAGATAPASALHESGGASPEPVPGNDLDVIGQPKFVAPGVTDVRVRYTCVGSDVRIGVRIRSDEGPDQTNRGARFGFVFGSGSTAICDGKVHQQNVQVTTERFPGFNPGPGDHLKPGATLYVGADLLEHFGNPEVTPLKFLAGEGVHGRRLVGAGVRV